MIVVAESVYDGTWASGALPVELVEFELMYAMRWDWRQLQATPVYVRRFCWDLLNIRRQAENDRAEREARRRRGH